MLQALVSRREFFPASATALDAAAALPGAAAAAYLDRVLFKELQDRLTNINQEIELKRQEIRKLVQAIKTLEQQISELQAKH